MLPTHRPPTHPGEMLLKEFLEPLGVSQAEAATRMSIPFQRLNGIVKGRRAVSADTALLLDALTGWDAQIWLTLQAKWDLWPHGSAKGCGNRPEQPVELDIRTRDHPIRPPSRPGRSVTDAELMTASGRLLKSRR